MSADPVSAIVTESFCYGNVDLCGVDININDELYNSLFAALQKTDPKRPLQDYWCLVRNIKSLESMTLEYIDFVEDVFRLLDERFGENKNISFKSHFAIKLYIINEMFHTITAVAIEKNIDEVCGYFMFTFSEIVKFIETFHVITLYKLPGDGVWDPIWKMEWVQDSCLEGLRDTTIDVHTDLILNNPKIYTYSKAYIVAKTAERLRCLKKEAPNYFKFLDGVGVIAEFSEWVFHNFPYSEIAKGYLQLIPVSSEVYLPDGVDRSIELIDLVFEIIPERLATYALGFSAITGELSRKMIRKYVQKCKKEGLKKYFGDIQQKNWTYIESKMYHEPKIGNLDEEGKQLNVLYFPVDAYNFDDTSVMYCNDFYYIFTYPEFENLSQSTTNPYNRKPIHNGYLNMIRDRLVIKNIMKEETAERGLALELNGTMIENYNELMENIMVYSEPVPKHRYLPQDMISLLFPNLN